MRKQLANSAILAGMAKFIRYAVATVCFAASVGCLALWWRSNRTHDSAFGPTPNRGSLVYLDSYLGSFLVSAIPFNRVQPHQRFVRRWHLNSGGISPSAQPDDFRESGRMFGRLPFGIYFPLWYPSLIFALAGVASLRLGRRFTLRSAIIAMTVVAGLLGIAVIL